MSKANGNVPPQEKCSKQVDSKDLEQFEEDKFYAKYPPGMLGPETYSDFLQSRLERGQKFFDSADYQMAKHKDEIAKQDNTMSGGGEAVSAAETVDPRKSSILQPSKKFPSNN